MERLTKILIVVVIILVAVIGVISGIFLQGYLSPLNNTTNSTNQTNVSVNNTTETNQTSDPNDITSNQSGVQYLIEGSAAAGRPYCPSCGSNNVDLTGSQYNDANNVTWYQVHCNYCGNTWYTRGPY